MVAGALAGISHRGIGSGAAVAVEAGGARCRDSPRAHVTVPSQCLDLGEEEKYPTWKRTLTRRAREAQMKRFCKAQVAARGRAGSPARHHPLSPPPRCQWPHAGGCQPSGERCPSLAGHPEAAGGDRGDIPGAGAAGHQAGEVTPEGGW